MKLAVIGSRDLTIQNLKDYIPPNVSEIVSGGALGIDTVAAEYADEALVFWNGHSKGTQYTIESFYRLGKKVTIIII